MRSTVVADREQLGEVVRGGLGWGFWLRWVVASAIAVPVGSSLGGIVGEAAHGVIFETLGFTVVGAVVGILQWLALRKYVRQSGWYTLATMGGYSLVGFAAGTTGWIFGGKTAWGLVGATDVAVRFAVGGTVAGIVVGAWVGTVDGVLQWYSLRRHVSPWFVVGSAIGEAIAGATSFTLAAAVGIVRGDILGAAQVFVFGGAVGGAATAAALVLLFGRTKGATPTLRRFQGRLLGKEQLSTPHRHRLAHPRARFQIPASGPKTSAGIANLVLRQAHDERRSYRAFHKETLGRQP